MMRSLATILLAAALSSSACAGVRPSLDRPVESHGGDLSTPSGEMRTLPSPNADGAPLVFLVERVDGDRIQVLLPVRPNGSAGWINANEVRLSRHDFHIEVRLSELRIMVLSGFSEVFESFNGGPGQLGIHGTNDPSSIGRKVSSGCVRMSNTDIGRLASMLPVGVPVDAIA